MHLLWNRAFSAFCAGGRAINAAGFAHTGRPKNSAAHEVLAATRAISTPQAAMACQQLRAHCACQQPREPGGPGIKAIMASPSPGGPHLMKTGSSQGAPPGARAFSKSSGPDSAATAAAEGSFKVKYVGLYKQGSRWRVTMNLNKRGLYLGSFDSTEEGEDLAASVFDAACYLRDGGSRDVPNFALDYRSLTGAEGTEKAERVLESVRPGLKEALRAAVRVRDEAARSRKEVARSSNEARKKDEAEQ